MHTETSTYVVVTTNKNIKTNKICTHIFGTY